MPNNQHHLFGPFRLDPVNEQVWRGGEEVILRRKTFEVLRYLVEHAGQLVTKTALLDAIWPEVVVSDSMPTICVGELRKALGDEAKTPQFIETVHGRGYRLIAKTTSGAAEPPTRPQLPRWELPPIVVGREIELARLQNRLEQAAKARRQVFFVAGEAGIGKTALIRTFLDSIVKANPTVLVGRGQCVQQYGEGEPYMPMLEALTRLSREPGGERLVAILQQFAPAWLAQMPSVIDVDDRAALQGQAPAATQQRMLREMAEALEAITVDRLLVLLFEDLHWSDYATLELIAAVARRSEPARLLVLATYRPAEMLRGDHPLRVMKEELELHGHCEELRLSALGEEHVAHYLAKRFFDLSPSRSANLASSIHKRSEGNPLFMVNVADFLLEAGILSNFANASTDSTAEAIPADRIDIPPNIRQMIERNLEQLIPLEQALLECASVAGPEFSAASLAAAVQREIAEIETCCSRLSRHEQFIRMEGPIRWPDGTLATRFRFRHALYQEVLYHRVPAGRRQKLHQRLAEREEAAFGERAGEIAAQLAHHFSRGGNTDKAIQYLRRAAERAAARGALLDAERLFTAALAHLKELPEDLERDRHELPLQLGIGSALWGREGWSHPEAERAFTRAQQLGERLGEARQLVEVFHGLAAAASSRARMSESLEFARRMLSLAERNGDHDLLCAANYLMGMTLFWRGELLRAQKHLELASFHSDDTNQQPLAVIGRKLTPIITSVVTLHQGFPDRARSLLTRSIAAEADNSLHLAFMHLYGAFISISLRDAEALLAHAQVLRDLSIEQPFLRFHAGYYEEIASLMRGERLARLPRTEEAKAFWNEIEFWLAHAAVLETEALYCASQGRFDDALVKLAEALNEAEEVTLRKPAILRFRAYLLRKSGAASAQVEFCYCDAIECARKQGNRFDELQSVTHFARWLKSQGRADQACTLLAPIYNWFTEGFDTVALKEAQNLLEL